MALSIPTFYCISGKQSLLCGVTCWCFVVLGVVIDKNLDDRNIAMALKERKKTDALHRLAMFQLYFT